MIATESEKTTAMAHQIDGGRSTLSDFVEGYPREVYEILIGQPLNPIKKLEFAPAPKEVINGCYQSDTTEFVRNSKPGDDNIIFTKAAVQ